MKIKKFVARSMPQALQQVRDDLGDNAVILNTRKLAGRERSPGEQVEITAGLEEPVAAVATRGAPHEATPSRLAPSSRALPLLSRMHGEHGGGAGLVEPPVRRLDLASVVPAVRPPAGRAAVHGDLPATPEEAPAAPPPRQPRSPVVPLEQLQEAIERMERLSVGLALPPALGQLAERLRQAGVSEALVRDCVHGVFRQLNGAELADAGIVSRRAAAVLVDRLPGRGDIRIGRERRVAAFVGASGAGKTTAIAKIAAGFAAKMRKRGERAGGIVIISTDTRRVGGLDQARSYAELIGVPLEVAYEAAEMRAALERHPEARLVLIDTPGCGVRERDERERQKHLLEVAGVDQVHVVVDGLTSLDHMLDLIVATEGLGDRRLLFSKIDEVVRPGAILSAAAASGLSISYLTAGAALPGGICPGDLASMVEQVIAGPAPGRAARARRPAGARSGD